MNDAVITLHDFGVAYENKTVLEGINTSIRKGRITAIIGPSGCGKSTMLKAMNRMLELQHDASVRGSIHLNGQDIQTIPADELRRRMQAGPVRLQAEVKTRTYEGISYTIAGDLVGTEPELPAVLVPAQWHSLVQGCAPVLRSFWILSNLKNT